MKFKLPFTKPNQNGFGHIELLVLIVFVAIFAFVGVRVLTQSHADSVLTSATCQLRGRVWASNGCTKTCIAGAGSHVVASPYDYCSNAISKISSATCASLGRKWINVGCARRWQQTNLLNAYQCLTGGTTYTVSSPYDKCVVVAHSYTLVNNSYVKVDACSTELPGYTSFIVQVTNKTSSGRYIAISANQYNKLWLVNKSNAIIPAYSTTPFSNSASFDNSGAGGWYIASSSSIKISTFTKIADISNASVSAAINVRCAN